MTLKISKPSEIVKEEYTNEFIMLGLLVYATDSNYGVGRMQLMKLLWKFKDLVEDKLKLQAFYTEPYKDKHGRFNKEFYDQLNNLKTAGFIETRGTQPLENFYVSQKGKKIFENLNLGEENKYPLQLVKSHLEYIIKEHGSKSAEILEDEDHAAIKDFEKLPLRDEALILKNNLKPEEIEYKFLFDDNSAIDWGLAISIGERKKNEKIVSPEELPTDQEKIYEILGL